jgi:hypothetical protein
MIVIRNSPESISITLETEEEKIGFDYEWTSRGPTAFKEFLVVHLKQRKEQKEYEELSSIFQSMASLSESDRSRIIKRMLELIRERKNK